MSRVTALIADDEPLLRQRLATHLARVWPELSIVAEARNGREAVELFETHAPEVVFLDVHMPGQSGIEAARSMVGRTQIVFVTAYEQYAVTAFEQGAIDYLIKPFDEARLEQTVARLRDRLEPPAPADTATSSLDARLEQLAREVRGRAEPQRHLQWIKASVGTTVRMIPIEQVVYFKSDEKYTLVVWEGGEALIRKTIRELVDELDSERYAQIHRSVIVNLACVSHVTRGLNETADVHLHGRSETLPVSRSWLHLFRQM
jgi:DNA-binding LytR/AlgR family response regulator